jgi:ribosome-associated translation inhibitor RaiA
MSVAKKEPSRQFKNGGTVMKKKLFAILLSIVMVVGLLPVTALAADPTVYGIWVDGVQVTSENKDNLCSGTVSYEPTTHTLSLNNATLDNDTMSDYGINTIIPSTLKIRLTGTNSITRTDPYGGMGIAPNSSNSVEITGDGTLVINVIGENYDGISTAADVKISDKARVIINSKGGLGIAGRMVEIDGATLNSTGLYAGIDAHRLKIVNGADVTLKATQDGRNGAYIWKDQEGNGGDIEIAQSTVKATSYYPGLFAAGNLTVDGGEVSCTSTADAALWTKGNILIKGGAKVTTDGKYPMGGNGTFTVEEAEIDAKNTNVNNIPAIFDECVPVIADGYHLNYAKAVDSEETEIDLLSSGTQYFALYKNVHFITKAVYPVSFVVTPDGLTNVVVKVNGQEVTGSVSLEAGTYPVEVTADNCKAYTGNITITADAATHTQTIAMTYLPADYTQVDEAIAKANALNKDNYKDLSAVEAAVNAVVRDKNITEQSEVDAMAKAIEDAIAALQYKDADYTKVDAAIAKANALNKNDYKDFSGVETAVKAVVRGKNITEQSEVDKMAKAIEDAIAALEKKPASTKPGTSDKSPQTGDTSNLTLWIALLLASAGAVTATTLYGRKKKHSVK